MWDVSDQLNPQNSPRPGRHRLDDDFDDFDEYSDYAEAPAAGGAHVYSEPSDAQHAAPRSAAPAAGAAAAGATAAATTGAGSRAAASKSAAADGVDDGDIGDGAGDGRYMRVLAIVLLAIGVCLVAYGAYALSTRGDDAENTGQNDTSASAPAESGAPADSANGSDPAKDGAAGDGDGEVPPPPPANEPGKPVPPAENPPAQGEANEAPQIDRKTVKVSVLNNSEVVGLADDLSKQMGDQGWGAGETGNAPEEKMGVWEKTTVYFDPRNEEEKAAAEQIAHDNGWEAAPRDDRLRDAPAGIVVVATDPAH
ncbi:LytR C-terminal domain-containing protein [Corynebacterium amycolatum]|uniref:LytR C-terminal domain-containing protein n=1 Tax=Corynebacterium amycolatum TaxID=43765 RepID=UPI003EE024EF